MEVFMGSAARIRVHSSIDKLLKGAEVVDQAPAFEGQ
jgi:hypothetical protein